MHYRLLASLLPIGLIVATASAQPAPVGSPGAGPTGATYGGTGIPNDHLMNGGANGVMLSLGAIARCVGDLPWDGAGTFFASPGQYNPALGCNTPGSSNYATWNFNFYVGGPTAGDYTYKLLMDIDPGTSVDMGQVAFLPGALPALGGVYQDSWNLGMLAPTGGCNPPLFEVCYAPPPTGSFDYNAPGVYSFDLAQIDEYGHTVADVAMNVNVTPEPATLVLLGTGLLGIAGVVRRRRRSSI